MIFNETPNGKEQLLSGWLCRTDGGVIQLPTQADVVDFCTCEFLCEYGENAWVFPTDTSNGYKNDYRAVLITLLDVSSTFSFKLVDASGVETDLIDNTFGEFFNVGFNTLQPLKAGYRVDWVKVFSILGLGEYRILVSQTDFGSTVTSTSHPFNVRLFNESAANFSVKIETVQTGVILNGEDYGGMEWFNMVRIKGTFGQMAPQHEIDRLVDSDRKDIDVQVTKFNQYTLATELLPDGIGDILTDDTIFTDEIFISNYEVFAYKQFRRLPVTFEGSVEAGDDYSKNNRKIFSITFKDRKQKVKRNFV